VAAERNWDTEKDVNFAVKGGLSDLVAGITDRSIDTFLWEKFTTKHCEEQKLVRFIGEVSALWPSFIITGRKTEIESDPSSLKVFLSVVQQACQQFLQDPNNVQLVSKTSNLDLENSRKWLKETEFSNSGAISLQILEETVQTLVKTKILKEKISISELYNKEVVILHD